jgi:drug/metabolite transporter (DMT)-like permease
MKLYLLVLGLSFGYILQYVLTKLLLKTFTLREILINAYIFSTIFLLFFLKDDLISSVKKIDFKYCILIFLAFISIFVSGFELIATGSNINIALIESMANSIYLPGVAIISYLIFNNTISYYNFFGVLLIAIGCYFINKK